MLKKQRGWLGESPVLAERAQSIYMILPSSLAFLLLEGHPCWSKCGRRTRPFSGRAFREHRTNVGVLPLLFIVRVPRAQKIASLHPRPLLAGFFSILLGAELNALGQRQIVPPIDRVRLPPHIGLPRIRTSFASTTGFFFTSKGAADFSS